MARKRFSPAEREIITAGARIEWQNVTQWHPVTVTDGVVRLDYGWQYVTVRCDETRGNVRRGDVIHAGPGKIRARASAGQVPAHHPATADLGESWSVPNPHGVAIHYGSSEEAVSVASTGIW